MLLAIILLLILVLLLPSGVASTTSRWIIILNNESRVRPTLQVKQVDRIEMTTTDKNEMVLIFGYAFYKDCIALLTATPLGF
jgi:hypothetical protein